MKKFYRFQFLTCLFILIIPVAKAQWNPNTSENILVSTLKTSDIQSVATSDSKTWIAFYHQNQATSNYDMRAQLIDANGYKLLGEDGVLVSDHPSGSATFVFNVCVDLDNNLIIGFQDQRSGPSLTTVLYKISQTGEKLWGDDGIVLGNGYSPYPAVLSTGEVVAAWIDEVSNTLKIQKITTSGTNAWTTPVSVMVGITGTTRGQPIGLTNGKFAMVYQEQNYAIYTTLFAQHFNNNGTSVYAPLQICGETTHASRYYSICAEGDTVYFGYYSAMGSRFNSWVQRINPEGSIPWGMNGSNFTGSPGSNNQMETNINLTAGKPHVWAVCTYSDGAQNNYGVYIQKFRKSDGTRLLTDNGKAVYPISSSLDQQQGELALVNDDPMFMNYDGNYKIYATRLDSTGNFAWPENRMELSSTLASLSVPKGRFGFTPDGPNRCAGIWVENRGSGYKAYAQGISVGGLYGINAYTQDSVPAVITTPAGTLQMEAVIYPVTASQAVIWSIIPGTGTASISASGLVTAITNGNVWAKAAAVQDTTMTDTVKISISGQTTGISSQQGSKGIFISPVPSSGQFTVATQGMAGRECQIRIYNMTGTMIYNSLMLPDTGSYKVDITGFPEGIYMVEVNDGISVIMKKTEIVR